MVDTFLDGLVIPSPPWCTGRAIRSLSRCLKEFCPVRTGRNYCRIVSSSGFRNSSMSGMVLERYVHLFIWPCVKAA